MRELREQLATEKAGQLKLVKVDIERAPKIASDLLRP
jgi:thioredoxin-like negative regulator of GroEL